MHLREAMGPPNVVIAVARAAGQLRGRALACAPLDRCGLGEPPTWTQARTLTAEAAVTVPATRHGDPAALASLRSA
jgi:hypothetical protein